MAFHFGELLSDQKDVRFSVPIPMVYESVRSEPLRWEYRVLSVDAREEDLPSIEDLNELGSRGWLLVGILDQGATGRSSLVHYYFVRQRQE
ncbi:MAG TPA: hypothetical protein VKV20_14035 [Ktedonobacteraceae bacterium]|jgi:hypothetical protein|nr:hypothetical protein [Ktedonobacteraceae bacterium]